MKAKLKLSIKDMTLIDTRVEVIETRAQPSLQGKVLTQRGICTDVAAAIWGMKRGVKKVYWIKALEKVYAVQGPTA